MSANAVQVGGDHYKNVELQPWDLIERFGLGYMEGNIVKYVSRWRKKGGREDLEKAHHYIVKLEELHLEEGRKPRVDGDGPGPLVLSRYFDEHKITDFREKILISTFCSRWTTNSFTHAVLLVGSLIETARDGETEES
jgi:hypothetical protein